MEKVIGTIGDFNELKISDEDYRKAKKTMTVTIEHDDNVYRDTLDVSGGLVIGYDVGDGFGVQSCCDNMLITHVVYELLSRLPFEIQEVVIKKCVDENIEEYAKK